MSDTVTLTKLTWKKVQLQLLNCLLFMSLRNETSVNLRKLVKISEVYVNNAHEWVNCNGTSGAR